MAEYNTIDEYIARFSPPQSDIMQSLRETIRKAAPEAIEKICWDMPTFYQNGNLLHFAANKKHLGLYAGYVAALEPFQEQIAAYETTKGSIHLPWDKPIPFELVAEITRFRVKAEAGKKAAKSKPKPKPKHNDD